MKQQQSPHHIIMVRPKNFAFDPETAESNVFQTRSKLSRDLLQQKAVQEFDESVRVLRSAGVAVEVFEDREEPSCPDAVFPNNWFSTHSEGLIILYPMLSSARRLERRDDIIDYLKKVACQSGKDAEILDLSTFANEGRYLEGTGSIVFDYEWKKAYACLSPRTDVELLKTVCVKLGYEPVLFSARDRSGVSIYHTNVMMWIGTKAVGVCLDSITDVEEKKKVLASLESTRRKVVPFSLDEIGSFCGNAYEVTNDKKELVLVISKSAKSSMVQSKQDLLKSLVDKLVVCDVDTIEKVGGGSIRCMIGGNFLAPDSKFLGIS